MTLEPVVPVWVLLSVAAAIVIARVAVLRRRDANRTRTGRWRWAGLTLAMLLLIVAAARPVQSRDDGATRVADRLAPNVFVVLDRSPDMLVADPPGDTTRIARAEEDLTALIDRFAAARIAVISFGSSATLQWPLSSDTGTLRSLVPTYQPYPASPDAVETTNAGAASNLLRYQLIGARQQYPAARTLVYYLGVGAPEGAAPPRTFDLPEGAVDGGAVLGYGTTEGGPIPGADVTRSVIDEPTLRAVAAQIGVPYLTRGADPLDTALPTDGASVDTESAINLPAASRGEWYWLPAILAAALILVELGLVLREFRRTRLTRREVGP